MTIFTKQWWIAAGIRSIKTFAEVAISMLTVGQAFTDLDWAHVFSVSGVATVIAFLTCLAGLPEVPVSELPVKDVEK